MLKKASFFLLSFCMTGSIAFAQVQEKESNLKAAFIYNFTRYIEWNDNNPDFVIGVIGSSLTEKPLREIAATNKVKNKRIVIVNYNKPEDIGNCNILFIPGHSPFQLSSILANVNRSVLTISEEPGFAKLGTALNFVLANDKLKFEANLGVIYISGLKVSSQLLKLAIIVD
jgi:hypothetical protein